MAYPPRLPKRKVQQLTLRVFVESDEYLPIVHGMQKAVVVDLHAALLEPDQLVFTKPNSMISALARVTFIQHGPHVAIDSDKAIIHFEFRQEV